MPPTYWLCSRSTVAHNEHPCIANLISFKLYYSPTWLLKHLPTWQACACSAHTTIPQYTTHSKNHYQHVVSTTPAVYQTLCQSQRRCSCTTVNTLSTRAPSFERFLWPTTILSWLCLFITTITTIYTVVTIIIHAYNIAQRPPLLNHPQVLLSFLIHELLQVPPLHGVVVQLFIIRKLQGSWFAIAHHQSICLWAW